ARCAVPRLDQHPRLAPAEVPRRRADPVGDHPRRDRHRDHDVPDGRGHGHRPRAAAGGDTHRVRRDGRRAERAPGTARRRGDPRHARAARHAHADGPADGGRDAGSAPQEAGRRARVDPAGARAGERRRAGRAMSPRRGDAHARRPSEPARRATSPPAAARAVAARVLEGVEAEAAFAELALDAELARRTLPPRDIALATELIYGTLAPPRDPVDALATRCSFPTWLAARWLARYGHAEAEALMRALNERPPLAVRANTLLASREAVAERLRAEDGLDVRPAALAPEGLVVEGGGAPGRWRAFADGACVVQDEASMLIARLLEPAPGDSIVDACAAPGT